MHRRTHFGAAARRRGVAHLENRPARVHATLSPARAPGPVVLRRLRTALFLALFALAAPPSRGELAPLPDVEAGTLLLRMQNGYETATLLDTDVGVDVSGIVARVSVRQEFRNDSDDWLEGIYVFPLPENAAVDRMWLEIGERRIEGVIRERNVAKQEYAAARASGRKTSLVEQHRPNLFSTSVANIAPREKLVVEIGYLQELALTDGTFSLRFPTTFTPRYIPGEPSGDRQGSGWSKDTTRVADASLITPPVVAESTNHTLSFEARIDAGMPLENVTSRYHPVNVVDEGDHYRVTLLGSETRMDHDVELTWRPERAAVPRALLFSEMIAGEAHYLLMVVPPDIGETVEHGSPRELIFIIDTSGSMHGTSIRQAKSALGRVLGTLTGADLFNIIEFNSETRALFSDSAPVTPATLAEARTFIESLDAEGGTEMRPALESALGSPARETHLRQLIFITDGSVGNEDELFTLIERQLGSARLFTVGIGSAPNGWFMRKAAEAGRGAFTTVSAVAEVGEKMDVLFSKIGHPQATDIRIAWPAGVQIESYPATVPDLYRGEPVVVRARAKGPLFSGSGITVSGNLPSGAWNTVVPLDREDSHAGVGALWARARIGELLDEERRVGESGELRTALVETALTHGLVSKYTSMVAVDRTPARPAGTPLGSEQVPSLLPHGQSMTAIFGFPATATAAAFHRWLGVWLLVAALALAALPRPGRARCALG